MHAGTSGGCRHKGNWTDPFALSPSTSSLAGVGLAASENTSRRVRACLETARLSAPSDQKDSQQHEDGVTEGLRSRSRSTLRSGWGQCDAASRADGRIAAGGLLIGRGARPARARCGHGSQATGGVMSDDAILGNTPISVALFFLVCIHQRTPGGGETDPNVSGGDCPLARRFPRFAGAL